MLKVGDFVGSDWGPAIVTEVTRRSITIRVTDGPYVGDLINQALGTPGAERLMGGRA